MVLPITIKQEIAFWLRTEVFPLIGIDRPSNFDEIVDFIEDDVKSAASPTDYHSGDFAIAFRRFLESKNES